MTTCELWPVLWGLSSFSKHLRRLGKEASSSGIEGPKLWCKKTAASDRIAYVSLHQQVHRCKFCVHSKKRNFLNWEVFRNIGKKKIGKTHKLTLSVIYISSSLLHPFYVFNIIGKPYFHLSPHSQFIPFSYFPKTTPFINLGYSLQSTFSNFTAWCVLQQVPSWRRYMLHLTGIIYHYTLRSRHANFRSSDFCLLSAA